MTGAVGEVVRFDAPDMPHFAAIGVLAPEDAAVAEALLRERVGER